MSGIRTRARVIEHLRGLETRHGRCWVSRRVDHGTFLSMFDLALLAPERLRPLRVREYDKLVDAGAIGDEHVELLGGVLVTMSPQGERHIHVSARIAMLLARQLSDAWLVTSHSPLKVRDDSKPEPDVTVRRPVLQARLPRPASLVVEVSDSSIVKDREIKRHFYAAARIPEYWLVDLRRERVEVRTRPSGDDYKRTQTFLRGEAIRPIALRGVSIAVSEFLPPRKRRAQ
jgi:Uma2 family endonuclease